jgi:LysM repeat protein
MDTISRENPSYLPIAGVVIGAIACILSISALVSHNKLSKKVPEGLVDTVAKIDVMDGEIRSATAAAEQAKGGVSSLSRSSQNAFDAAGAQIQELRGEIEKLKEAAKPKAPVKGVKGPVVAGEGEYVVKPGDLPSKIAKANGCTVAELQAVNPSVNWSKLHAGQKIKLPKK